MTDEQYKIFFAQIFGRSCEISIRKQRCQGPCRRNRFGGQVEKDRLSGYAPDGHKKQRDSLSEPVLRSNRSNPAKKSKQTIRSFQKQQAMLVPCRCETWQLSEATAVTLLLLRTRSFLLSFMEQRQLLFLPRERGDVH
jgi:hypothetical protein